MDRIGRLLGNVFSLAPPYANGNGAKALAAPPAETKYRTVFTAGVDFIPLNGSGDLLQINSAPLERYSKDWLVYACLRYRAEKMSEPPLWIREEKDGEESWIEGEHPIGPLLRRPNPDQRLRAFLFRTSLLLDATGRCVWVKVRDNRRSVAALRAFSNEDVIRTEPADGRMFGRFHIQTARGPEWYGYEDVIHLYEEDPANPYGCVAPLSAALARLNIETTLIESLRQGLRNAVVPGYQITFPPEVTLTEEQRAEFRASLATQYENARNHGRSMVFGGGAVGQQNKLGFEGLKGGELSGENVAAVCAVFSIPPVVLGAAIGLENSSDRHNLETSRMLFYENAVFPRWAQIEEAMTDDLLPEFDGNGLRFIRFDRLKVQALQADMQAQSEMVERLRMELDLDERRAILGYAPATPEQAKALAAKPAAAVGDTDEEDGEKARSSVRERKALDPASVRWTLFDAVTRSQEYGWEVAAAAQLEEDRAAILALISNAKAGTGPTERKDDDDPAGAEFVRDLVRRTAEYLDMSAKARWTDRIRPLTEASARNALERAAAEIGISFDLLQPGLTDYVQREAAWLVTQVTDTTKQAIRDALSAGLLEGAPIRPSPDSKVPSLVERIEQSGAFSRSRAELIARTEVTRTANGAAVEGLRAYQAEHGGRFQKRWLSARDSRVRDEHRALDGETVDLDQPFSNGLQHPGEPNCRCTTLLEMSE